MIPGSIPYVVVTTFLYVDTGKTLTIDPGVVVKLGANGISTSIRVYGTLDLRGTASQQIVFTSYRDDEYGGDTNGDGSASLPAAGDWGGIEYYNNNVLHDAVLRYGGAEQGMVQVAGSAAGALEIRDCVIEKARTGIYVPLGVPLIEGNTIRQTERPIYQFGSADPIYSGNVLTGNTYNAICVGGTISGSITWEWVEGSIPYVVTSSLTVATGQTLSIDPGVVVKMGLGGSGASIHVSGTLDLRGTASQQVVFTSYRDDEYGGDTNGDGSATGPSSFHWSGIVYYNNNNVLHDAILRYGGAGKGTVQVDTSTAGTLVIRDCLIEKANSIGQAGIYVSAGSPVIEGNTIRQTTRPIYQYGSADPIYSGNVLTGNTYNAICVGGMIRSSTTWELVQGSIPYVVVDVVNVDTGQTLSIDPGVVVKLGPIGSGIHVNGTLDLRGTSSEKVVFTSYWDDEYGGDINGDGSARLPASQDWGGISYGNNNNVLHDAILRYGGWQNGMVVAGWSTAGTLVIRDCLIEKGRTGIYASAGSPEIEGNTIRQTERPIFQTGSAEPIYSGNVLAGNTYNAICVGRTISGSTTWELVQGSIPYVVVESLTVATGQTVSIDPGVVVKLVGIGGNILVNGTLALLGTASQQVVFTSYRDDECGGDTNGDGSASLPAASDWGYIQYFNNSNVLHDAILRYGGAANGMVVAGASTAGTLVIRDCLIEKGRTGIYASAGSPEIEGNTIRQTERPIFQTGSAEPIYSGNVLAGNTYNAICVGGAVGSSTTWELVQGWIPYVVVESLTVATGQTVSIDAGVVVKLAGIGGNILVDGTLDLRGTASQPVVFTSYRDDEYGGDTNGDGSASLPAASDWGSIQYSNNTNVLHDAILRYGGSGNGMVEIVGPATTIRQVTFDYFSNPAIKLSSGGAGTTVHNVNFLNTSGYGILNSTTNVIDARSNYWGSPTGPGGVGPGTGALVSSNVIYSPWLTSPVVDGTAQVVDRRIFYNNSSFDAGGDNLAALAPSPAELAAAGKNPNLGKEALLPGGTATFKNYISYSRGINGIFVDVLGLNSTNLTAADFTFKIGNDDNPLGWATAATPSIAVGLGIGVGGSDRITLVWPDNAIPNGNWLQVTLKTETSGLTAPDVFYFGSAMGETGNNAWGTAPDAKVSSLDAALTRLNNSSFTAVGIENVYDFNRDTVVNSFDAALCRLGNNLLNPLKLIQTPATAPMATFASAPSAAGSAALVGSTRQEMLYSDLAYSMELAQVQKERAARTTAACRSRRTRCSPSTIACDDGSGGDGALT